MPLRIDYIKSLPIYERRREIVEAIRDSQVVVITGETGSGKTTQIPKMCLEAGRGKRGLIGCTQPRRVAAVSAAYRLAEELGEEIGKTVSYKIRFAEKGGPHSQIKVMTDGVLLAELAGDHLLRKYDTIIVDEAHERSINIDFVMGYLRSLLPKRPDLKLIITSATIDAEKFSRAFGRAPVIEVSGRLYPVDIIWRPLNPSQEETGDYTYLEAAIGATYFLFSEFRPADTLIFFPTEQDIREACGILEQRLGNEAVVLPLFARLPLTDQRKVFLHYKRPKIICATNVAETSLTIPGIRYVIDSGLARISWYNPRTKTAGLPIRPISRSSADQRSGRCGRVMDGICVRLFSEEDYLLRPLFTTPEILRSNFAQVLLQMLYLRLGHVTDFPFIDPPSKKHISDAIDTLRELGALPQRGDLELTNLGKIMARLPLDPRVARMVIEGKRRGCLEETITIASVLGIGDPRETTREKEANRFRDPSSDFLSLLKIWQEMQSYLGPSPSRTRLRKYCREHALSYRRVREWMEVKEQVSSILFQDPIGKTISAPVKKEDLYPALHKAILSGYLVNVAEKKEKHVYRGTKGREIMIFPSSGLFKGGGKWIVAAEIVATSRLYARMTANIEPEWIEEVGKDFCQYSYSDPYWDPEREDVIAREKVSFMGLVICPGRNVSMSRLKPEEAQPIFIRDGLMKGALKSRFPFLHHNLELLESLRKIEHKTRRVGVIDEEAIFKFYSERLPGIGSVAHLKKFLRQQGNDNFLFLKEVDCLRQPVADDPLTYPDYVTLSQHALPLTYRFHPGEGDDGVTLPLPVPLLTKISSSIVDRLVPGLLREKILFLLKGLPKEYRRKLPPPQEWLEELYQVVKNDSRPLAQSLSVFIKERFGLFIPPSTWPSDRVPDYLKIRLAVIDEKNNVLAEGRDINQLKGLVVEPAESEALKELRQIWERRGMTTWEVDSIPEEVTYEGPAGIKLIRFPAFSVAEKGVDLLLFSIKEDAEIHHLRGVARLYELELQNEIKTLKKTLELTGDMKIWAQQAWGSKPIEKYLYEKVILDTLALPIRSRSEFNARIPEVRRMILPRAYAVLELARPFLEIVAEIKKAIIRTEQREGKTPTIQEFLEEIEEELIRLAPADFLLRYEESRLAHLPRYLKALAVRLERGISNLEKDRKRSAEIRRYTEKLASIEKEQVDPKLLEEFRWMIEEYRVSLFAQELKTAFPISPKRLKEKLAEIEM